MAAASGLRQTRGSHSVTFGPSFVWKWSKGFQLQGASPHNTRELRPLTPTRDSAHWSPLGGSVPKPSLSYGSFHGASSRPGYEETVA